MTGDARGARDLVSALEAAARADRPGVGLIFADDAEAARRVSYAELLDHARGAAAGLAASGVAPGDRVAVLADTSPELAAAFFGLLSLGATPSLLAPPRGFGGEAAFGERIGRTVRYLGARAVVVDEAARSAVAAAVGDSVAVVGLAALAPRAGPPQSPPAIAPEDVAYVQATSGSTAAPKGVVLSHGAIVRNIRQIGDALGLGEDDVWAGWLPLHHDMGLFSCLCLPVVWNIPGILLSPGRFLRRPASFLEAITRHRGTVSPAPNFAYAYAVGRVTDEQLSGLDLSSWRLALCGAEPIDAAVLRAFGERFASVGLPPHAVTPCYGLAEATLAVSFHDPGTPLLVDRVDRDALAGEGRVVDVSDARPGAVDVVSCGAPVDGAEVAIVDDDGAPLPEDRVGRVRVRSPSLMTSYLDLPEETAEVMREGWLDTGDLGYLRDGRLRITGRRKDVIVIRGYNHAPSDIEWAAESVPGVRRGNAVAFGIPDAASGTETVCVVCETDVEGPVDRATLESAIRERVGERTGLAVSVVELVGRGGVWKTTSGKLRRGAMRAAWIARQGAPR